MTFQNSNETQFLPFFEKKGSKYGIFVLPYKEIYSNVIIITQKSLISGRFLLLSLLSYTLGKNVSPKSNSKSSLRMKSNAEANSALIELLHQLASSFRFCI